MTLAYQRCVALLSASVITSSFMLLSAPARAQDLAPDSVPETSSTDLAGAEIAPDAASEALADSPAVSANVPVLTAAEPGAAEPGVDEPGMAEPEVDEPGVAEPSADEPGANDPAQADIDSDLTTPLYSPRENTIQLGEQELADKDLYTDYLLGPGDQLETRIIGYEDFEWSLTNRIVLSDGTIRVPFIGTIVAAGKTVERLEDEIANQLELYLTVPVVDINLTNLRPVVVNVVGEVYRPGPVQLGSLTQATTNVGGGGTLTTSANTPNLSSALAAAGGIRRTADVREVTVSRRMPDGSTKEFTVNLWEALKGDVNLGVLVMFDGDTIYVPRATTASGLDQSLIASSSIAPDNVRVRVVGEGVVSPGEVQVQPNSSISSAIAAAGGPTMEAELSQVKIVRMSESGQIEEETVNVSSLVDDYQIQDGDVVLVPKKGYLVGIDNFNRALAPLLGPVLSILGLFNIFN